MYTNWDRSTGRDVKIEIGAGSPQTKVSLYALVCRCVNALHAAADLASVRANFLNVDCCSHDFYVVETELASLGNDFSVDYHHCTSVVVKSVAVASLQVGV
jgi:hypothetical protein